MQILRRFDQLEKAMHAGKEFVQIPNFPEWNLQPQEQDKLNWAINLINRVNIDDRNTIENSLMSAINILKETCVELGQIVNKQKQMLSNEPRTEKISFGKNFFIHEKNALTNIQAFFNDGIANFKTWDKSNRKFNGNEYDAKAWREYMGYFVKYFSLAASYSKNLFDEVVESKNQSQESNNQSQESNNQSQEFDDENIVDLDDLYGFEPGQVEEYAIYNEFNININELNELYQELDRIYDSMSSTERRYFMENGEVPDQNKQSKIADTWDRIKQWFRRTFLTIITKFKKMQVDHNIDKIMKAAQDGKTIGIINNFPFYIPGKTGADASSINMALNLIINNLTVSETPVNKGI
jgi:hypothetical protein